MELESQLATNADDNNKLEVLLAQFERKIKLLETARTGSAVDTHDATVKGGDKESGILGGRLIALQARFVALFDERDAFKSQLDEARRQLRETQALYQKEKRASTTWNKLYRFLYRPMTDRLKAEVKRWKDQCDVLEEYLDELEGAARMQLQVVSRFGCVANCSDFS